MMKWGRTVRCSTSVAKEEEAKKMKRRGSVDRIENLKDARFFNFAGHVASQSSQQRVRDPQLQPHSGGTFCSNIHVLAVARQRIHDIGASSSQLASAREPAGRCTGRVRMVICGGRYSTCTPPPSLWLLILSKASWCFVFQFSSNNCLTQILA